MNTRKLVNSLRDNNNLGDAIDGGSGVREPFRFGC